ncbi:hypothetical protein J3P80_08895 [Pseudomonas sp. D2-30]|uniref:hypothetical protein n=1 Tax=unclassified Pseudomonas TaxID=196821 RepID=UPI003DA7F375
MNRGATLLSVILGLGSMIASLAHAEWMKSEIKDEMRGTSTIVFSQTSSPLAGDGPSVTLMVLDDKDGKPGVVFNLNSGRTEGCPAADNSFCNVNVKFDEGKITEELFATTDGKQLIPSQVVAFAGSVSIAKKLFIEVELQGVGTRQYKFIVGDLDIPVDRTPSVKLLGYELGRKYSDVPSPLKKVKANGLDVCYEGEGLTGLFSAEPVNKATLCFFNGVFYSAVIIPGTKASYVSGEKYLTKIFGKPDPEALYPSWPNKGDNLLNKNTKRAAYFTFSPNSYYDPLVITDEIVSPLVP